MLPRIITRVPRRTGPIRIPSVLATQTRTRFLSTTAPRMKTLAPLQHPVSTGLPSDSFHLLSETEKTGAAEDALYQQQIKDVEAWWASPRFEGIRRDYTAADIVAKRGSLQQNYPSSLMARKLWNLIQERSAEGKPLHTLGVMDPVQMTQQAANQEVVYLSGWVCSSTLTTTNEVSPDFGDYPYDTVPNQVERIFKAQSMHDRKQWDARVKLSPEDRAKTQYVDYFRPIVADGDTGHGGLTAVRKLAKLFAENGAAGVHFEDQMHGGKKCGHLAGKVLVTTGEHINRLKAVRHQWDVLGTENLVIARTDSESGKLINSTVDPRDHEFILGVADPTIESLAEKLHALEVSGASGPEIDVFEAEWVKSTKLVSFDEAAEAHFRANNVGQAKIQEYKDKVAADRDMSVGERRKLASEIYPDSPVYFSWDVPRTREGFYHFRAGMEAATKRSIAFAPYADLLWAETGDPNVKVATDLARAVRAVHPGKCFVYNLSPSFNWMSHGFTPETLKSFIWDIAKEGFVFQLVSLAGLHSTATITNELSKKFKTDGMGAYVELVQKREKDLGVDVLTHQKWSGANYVDGILGAIQSGSSGSKSMGEGNTEGQFE